jgi:hypothetical protein
MSIDPLQMNPSRALPETRCARKNNGGAASGFETLLGSWTASEKSQPSHPEQSAAELLRMEMMLRSLAVAGEDGRLEAASCQTLRSLCASMPERSPFHRLRDNCTDVGALEHPEEGTTFATVEGAAGIEATASRYLGTPYRFGGEGRDGIDCSSFVQQVYQERGVGLPRTAREQIQVGRDVAKGDLQKGDLVFFQTYASYPSHVGIYLGDGKMIHASSEKGEVTVSDMNSDYYLSRYLGARRVA